MDPHLKDILGSVPSTLKPLYIYIGVVSMSWCYCTNPSAPQVPALVAQVPEGSGMAVVRKRFFREARCPSSHT